MAFNKKSNNPKKIQTIPHPTHTNYSLVVLEEVQYTNSTREQSVWVCRDKTRIVKLTDAPGKLEKTIKSGLKRIETMVQTTPRNTPATMDRAFGGGSV